MKRNITEVPSQTSKKVWTESGDSGLGEREKLDLSFGDTMPTDTPVSSARDSPVPDEEEVNINTGGVISKSHRKFQSL